MNKTLCILKPDAGERGLVGKVLTMIEEAGFTKLEQRIDEYGIFTVSLARRN